MTWELWLILGLASATVAALWWFVFSDPNINEEVDPMKPNPSDPKPETHFQRFVIERLNHQDAELDAILRILNAMTEADPELKAALARLRDSSAALKKAVADNP